MKLELPAKLLAVFVMAVVLAAGCSGGGGGSSVGESGGGGVVSGGESGEGDGAEGDGAEEVVGLLDSSGCSDGSWLEDPSVGAVSDCEVLVGLHNRVAGGRVRSEVSGMFGRRDGDAYWVWGNRGMDRWEGVELNEDGRVVGLELWFGGELEVVPEEIVEFSELQELVLEDNGFSGELPDGFGGLSELEVLSLNNNGFVEIPSEVFKLENLRELFVLGNRLERVPVEIGGLSGLVSLGLTNNVLRGSIPAEIGDLVNLEWLDLSNRLESRYERNNQLTGPIPAEIGKLAKLRYLNLSGNRLSGAIPSELGGLGELEELWLFSNRLSGQISAELGNLGSLVDLDLNDNLLEGSIPSELGNLVSLESLSLSRNHLVGRIPSELANLVLEGEEGGLEWLTVWENDLCGTIPERLYRMDNFTFWDNPRLGRSCVTGEFCRLRIRWVARLRIVL